MITILYYSVIFPHADIALNKVEIFNEAIVLLCSYLVFAFTDYSTDAKAKFKIGYFYCFLVFLLLAFNICFIFGRMIFQFLKNHYKNKK